MNLVTADGRPVYWNPEIGAFVVSGFDEASAVLRGEGWSSDVRISPLTSPELRDLPMGNLLITDPPDHTRMRRPITPAFTPKAIESLRPRVAAIVESVLDGLDEVGPQLDVLADVGYPLARTSSARCSPSTTINPTGCASAR